MGLFHGFDNLLDFCTGISAETGQHFQIDVIPLGHLHRAVVEDLGAQAGQLQHLVKGDLLQLFCPCNTAGIGSIYTIHIGVDLAQVRVERGGQRHRRGVRTAPAQSGNVVILVNALETGDQHNLSLIQFFLDALGAHSLDSGVTVRRICEHPCLPARERDGLITHTLNAHGAQGNGDLLSSGQEHIHLPLGSVGIELLCFFDQVVGGVPLGGQDHHNIVASLIGIGDDTGHISELISVSHRAAAKFLYNE